MVKKRYKKPSTNDLKRLQGFQDSFKCIDNDQKNFLGKQYGFKNIKVVGNPVLEKIHYLKRNQSKSILFVSEPDPKKGFVSSFFSNYQNKKVLMNLINSITVHFPRSKIYFRMHPKEKTNINLITDNFKFFIDRFKENESLKRFNYFIGYDTIFLKKALLSGANVLFLHSLKIKNNFNIKFSRKHNSKLFKKLKKTINTSEIRCHNYLNDIIT